MWRKRKNPTPHFKAPPPYNPLHGENANLRQEGTSPFCAMMQVAAEDTYDDYVICRGFDPRILRFIDYAEGDSNKPGISVAKPFGKRTPGTYEIAEVYPALLPTQGNANFQDFRQVVYVPPSPVAVEWRVGQNPGVVTGGGLEGGQPAELTDEIAILYDHNGKAVNWLLVDGGKASKGTPEYVITSLSTAVSGPYTGLVIASVVIKLAEDTALIGTTVDVVDHSGCIFDEESMAGWTGWCAWGAAWSLDPTLDPEQECETLTPKHWYAINRCCAANSGTYADPCA
jgi:hypothetical protein